MKHIKRISAVNAKANVLEDLICQVGQLLALVLTAVGGSAPFSEIIDQKCILAPPPGTGE